MPKPSFLLALLALGCVPSRGTLKSPSATDAVTTTPEPTLPLPTTPTDTTPTTVETGDTGGPDPCLSLPSQPLSARVVPGILTSEEFVFDATGFLYSLPDGADAVFRWTATGDAEFVAPFSAIEVAGVRVLVDGGLAVANEWSGAVERVDVQTGSRTVLASGINSPNSMAVGPDGRLYIAAYTELVRVDPVTLDIERLATFPGSDLDGLTFSPDYRRLYFNHDDTGQIDLLTLDGDGNVLNQGNFASITVGWQQLDGMATDMCGNLYVTETGGTVYRVTPLGVVTVFAEASVWGAYTTAVQFGSGVGDWKRDHLYLMDRNLGVVDLDVGIDGRPEPHL